MKRLIVLLVLAVPLYAFGDSNTKLIRTGETIAIPDKFSLQEIEAAILDGSRRKGWEPKKLKDGTIEDTLHIRSHIAVVHVVYNTESFRIDYADSSNLVTTQKATERFGSAVGQYTIGAAINSAKGKEGEELIHKNYYVWTQGLSNYILQSLAETKKSADTAKVSAAKDSVPNKLRELENLRKEGVITNEEYQKKKQQLLDKF
jgi:hypothetical protein